MRFWESIIIFTLLFVLNLSIFYRSLDMFFTQDDFILINDFSSENLINDLKNTIDPSKATHWRPLHNLYFLVSGNLFGKFYPAYHLLTLVIHTVSAFMIFKVLRLLIKNTNTALLGAIIYAVHPSHFVSIFWISGSATVIGFLFLISCFYLYLKNKKSWALVLFVLSFLASEAMVAGAAIFTSYELFVKRKIIDRRFLLKVAAISLGFLFIRFLFLTSDTTFRSYPIEISRGTVDAVFYYFLRLLGFAETSKDVFTSIVLIFWIAAIAFAALKILRSDFQKLILFFIISALIGLFPFFLIPSHLSPHYMNIAIWAFAALVSLSLLYLNKVLRLFLILVFVLVGVVNIQLTYQNNWVVKRSKFAKQYIEKIKTENPPDGALLTFDDSAISSSSEAYFALGTGKAIDFWFEGKNYTTCFSTFENCPSNN